MEEVEKLHTFEIEIGADYKQKINAHNATTALMILLERFVNERDTMEVNESVIIEIKRLA